VVIALEVEAEEPKHCKEAVSFSSPRVGVIVRTWGQAKATPQYDGVIGNDPCKSALPIFLNGGIADYHYCLFCAKDTMEFIGRPSFPDRAI